ncbi:PQQ-dependent catabolism-associated CXXCW motif protein [Ancylobacter sp. MQZ15Z-1]|uniref:PQQ-dependent catabolism-associated CXXCW motif protein n=1 Tax=Ancylobacter mangrovi TaxID=2972472 RepID=A0A9X2PHH6_9HYPH|nr:PQQ-dependent catabolism-associated CXXCW motif protein [Ancylobacter mangrovi]MCS0496248.1 PQQ-dependent catabolism-associated CXXCW motif protein [Ancylobacter mangrovi]
MSPHHEPPLTRLAWIGIVGLALVLFALSPVSGQTPANTPAVAGAPVPEPDGYRMDAYRAPTPATLKGARVIDTAEAERLWRDKAAIFVDVLPRDVKPANLPPGTIWRDKKHDNVPGSVWLPNVGYGVLNAEMDDYFRHGLDALADGRQDAPLVFYCKTDCWMSWNAAKRAMTYGYTNIVWYPGGSDGWAQAGLPVEQAKPRE